MAHLLAPDNASAIDDNVENRRAVGDVLAAYNRNREAWSATSPGVERRMDVGSSLHQSVYALERIRRQKLSFVALSDLA